MLLSLGTFRKVWGMKITGEQIKEARERLHLTQQELAAQVGVSMRTVGNWERGESVPRSRMGAIRQVLRLPGPDDNRLELSRLINEELSEAGRGPVEATRSWTSSAQRSFYSWKDGSSIPSQRSRGLLEGTLGWRKGSVTEILDAPITKRFTLSEVRDWSQIKEVGLVKAKHLSNAELGSEIVVRLNAAEAMREELERLRAELDELRGSSSNVVQLHGNKGHYDLAASDEHVPGEDDRD